MHKHEANIIWERKNQKFVDNKYSRAHRWVFDGVEVPASSSPSVLSVPLSSTAAIDPEEALVAATSSCHMLFFCLWRQNRDLLSIITAIRLTV